MKTEQKQTEVTDTNQPALNSGLDAPTCSAWIPATNPPKRWTRVIAKNECDDISEASWLNDLEGKPDGFYVALSGGQFKLWKHVTHYIPWPNTESCDRAKNS